MSSNNVNDNRGAVAQGHNPMAFFSGRHIHIHGAQHGLQPAAPLALRPGAGGGRFVGGDRNHHIYERPDGSLYMSNDTRNARNLSPAQQERWIANHQHLIHQAPGPSL
jgi:hypothetical protein